MDEPTVALADAEVERVFSAIARLQQRGVAVLFVSHRLGEILRVSERVTVMKDGRTVATHHIGDLDRTSLVEHIIGREAGGLESVGVLPKPVDKVVLEARQLCGGPLVDVNLQVRAGEIVGIGGLVGSGRTSLLTTLFGRHRPASGQIFLDGREVTWRSPADAIRAGLALLPEDRRADGLIPRRSVRENVGTRPPSTVPAPGEGPVAESPY